jgi:hypothetical protein
VQRGALSNISKSQLYSTLGKYLHRCLEVQSTEGM